MSGTNSRSVRAEVHGTVADSLDCQLWDVWTATTAAFPTRDALVSMWQPASIADVYNSSLPKEHKATEYLRLSYADLRSGATHLSNYFRSLGCKPGMRIAVVLGNSAEWALLFWATAKLGMVFVPIDARNLSDLPSILDRLNPQILVVRDPSIAASIDGLGSLLPVLKFQCSGSEPSGWYTLGDALHKHSSYVRISPEDDPQIVRSPDDLAIMILTSGTMGQPKICKHTHMNLMSQACTYDTTTESAVERWLVHTPVSHIFAVNNTVRAWKEGGTVVFPAESFDIEATCQALEKERCTFMSATPTLVRSLSMHSTFNDPERLSLDLVTLGGTTITRQDVKLCRDELGAKNAIQAYGMTEGAPLISWRRNDELLQNGYHPGVGRVLPGAAVRICHPETRDVLAIGQVGELHVAGSSLMSGYFGVDDHSAFYEADGSRWFATGDQGMIDSDSVVHLVGRYKDLIIRGSENIQPAKIERALAKLPGLQVTVVGVPDISAGQVPVAVVELPRGVDKASVAETSLRLGPMFALGGIYTLEELDMTGFPLTTLGKVKRGLLTDIVTKFRHDAGARIQGNVADRHHEALIQSLMDFWEQITSVRPHTDQIISYIADSISMLRFCDSVVRHYGKQFHVQDLAVHNTVRKQAELLESRNSESALHNSLECQSPTAFLTDITRDGISPCSATTSHAAGWSLSGTGKPQSKQNHLLQSILPRAQEAWRHMGLSDIDVEDAIPVRDSLHRLATGQRAQSYNIAFTFRVPDVSHAQIRAALRILVHHHALLRSILCRANDHLYHVVPTFSEDLVRNIAQDVTVDTVLEASNYAEQLSKMTQLSPLMLKAAVIDCLEDHNQYLSLIFNHSIMDAMAIVPWFRNLDLLLQKSEFKLPAPTSYALFADLHDQLSGSRMAKAAVNFHVKRLRGISILKKAFWPVQKAPGWMISDDSDSAHKAERDSIRRAIWKGSGVDIDSCLQISRTSRLVHLPQLPIISDKLGVAPSNFTKAAIAIFNVLQTSSSHAIFTSWESSRSWPFLPKWIEDKLPPVMGVDGPTLEWMLNMVEVIRSEKLGDFLQRIHKDQDEAEPYAHAPWSHVQRALQDEGELALEASFRQGVVWDVSLLSMVTPKGYLTDLKVLEFVNRHNWADCGLFWNAFAIDPHSIFFISSWDTAQMNIDEVEKCCDMLAHTMRKLAAEENWHRSVGEVFA